jgi:hypothetical protein
MLGVASVKLPQTRIAMRFSKKFSSFGRHAQSFRLKVQRPGSLDEATLCFIEKICERIF